jgi:hypothetical protein
MKALDAKVRVCVRLLMNEFRQGTEVLSAGCCWVRALDAKVRGFDQATARRGTWVRNSKCV